ncbi:c-type cytochrome domain-containing protein [Arcticibacterium luteifluviistationis]|uniref:Peptidylprolyl isomerase n=1 Tax=Arcticibacterium luteifluviistationis TaxID=1784714 RepID=A0A2Z4GHC3_9BACT|nr:c-type cytochrome domain-containing protein [Arcticibacterium luteifluviistationis]AWW00657.1 peptidylprolyl isomerase [Arcticibacterium luteifluviistationis]
MNRVQKVASPILIFLNVMLVFLLVFESKVDLPLIFAPLGRVHPLFLHFPIGVFFVAAFLHLGAKFFKETKLDELLKFLFLVSAFTAVLTALFGFFLGQESGYAAEQLKWHKWLGILTSLVLWGAYFSLEKSWKYSKPLTVSAAIIILITGHLGGEITHGVNYVLAPLQIETKKPFDPNGPIFAEAINPILEAKCLSCHNDKKMKGELNMASLSKIMKGGEDGPLWLAGDALNSHIIKSAKLPLDDKKHMPPKGKPQLTALEVSILERWINQGAKPDLSLAELSEGDSLHQMVMKQYGGQKEEKTYEFSAVSESTLADVKTPFCTVEALALNSPALKANFYVTERYDPATLSNLKKVSEQLVELNLAKMPVSDEDLSLIAGFENLEKLVLNSSDITGKNLDVLVKLKNLVSLSLSGCALEKGSLEKLAKFPALEQLFVWNTGLDVAEVDAFEKSNKKVVVSKGFVPTDDDMLKINPPNLLSKSAILKEGEKAQLKHGLPNVTIRYVTDAAQLDSVSGTIYKDEIPLEGFTKVKALATKNGWYASDMREFTFYRSSFKADSAWLLSPTNKQYPGVGSSTVIDQKQGDKANFKDFAWLGYKGSDAEILLKINSKDKLKGLTVSYMKGVSSYIMPPQEVQVWAGDNRNDLKLIATKSPEALKKEEPVTYEGLNFTLDKSYKYIKIVGKPINKLPKWHGGAGEKAWLFIDEIYLY